jgi:hypothetical protein
VSVTSNDFSTLPSQDMAPPESGRCGLREVVEPLPPLSDWQAEQLERMMARGELPYRQEDGRGAAGMLGAVALAGVAMVAGAAYALWHHLSPVTGG